MWVDRHRQTCKHTVLGFNKEDVCSHCWPMAGCVGTCLSEVKDGANDQNFGGPTVLFPFVTSNVKQSLSVHNLSLYNVHA